MQVESTKTTGELAVSMGTKLSQGAMKAASTPPKSYVEFQMQRNIKGTPLARSREPNGGWRSAHGGLKSSLHIFRSLLIDN